MINPITICFILLMIAVIVNLVTRDRYAVFYTLLLAVLSLCLLMLDNHFASDQEVYRLIFDAIEIDSFYNNPTEPGYALLNGLVKYLGGNFNDMLFVINAFSMIVVVRFFNKYSPLVAVSWLIYFAMYFGYNLAALRQGVAMTMTLLSFQYIVSRNLPKYCLCLVIGFLFHTSILFFVPAYWIANKVKVTSKVALIMMLLAAPLSMINFLDVIFSVASKIGVPAWQIELYLKSDGMYYEQAGLSMGLVARVILFIGFAATADLSNKIQRVLFNLYFLYLIMYFPLSSAAAISSRGLDYYKIFDCLIIPLAIVNMKNSRVRLCYILFVLAFFTYSVFNQHSMYLDMPELDSALQQIINIF